MIFAARSNVDYALCNAMVSILQFQDRQLSKQKQRKKVRMENESLYFGVFSQESNLDEKESDKFIMIVNTQKMHRLVCWVLGLLKFSEMGS